jgi:hypothetical protein
MATKKKAAAKKKAPKKKIRVLLIDTKNAPSEVEIEYTGDESIAKAIGSKTYATQVRRFRETYLTVYYDPEKQSQSNGPISEFAYGSDDDSETIIGKAIVASTTDAGYIGSLTSAHLETIAMISRQVSWRKEEEQKVYYGLMASDRK